MTDPEPEKPAISVVSDEEGRKWGYDMYPERRSKKKGKNWAEWAFNYIPDARTHKHRCEQLVYKVFKQSPILKLMVNALEKNGCPVDFSRHISCEYCEPLVTGGYDPIQNQVVVCHNTCNTKGIVHMVLYHELIHMYDNCVGEVDFQNIEHLACSEIRAANLTYCGYLSAFFNGHISRSAVKYQQRECVKKRAIDSVLAVREVSLEEAEAAVNKVFKRCYNDTEPIGRRMRPRSMDADLAYSEAFLLGYD